MSIPLRQQAVIARYLLGRHLRGVRHYPLVLMLEPLFRCNLACAGCGKIAHQAEVLKRQMSVQECLDAVDECGAPVVSIAGGEPLLHSDIVEIVRGCIRRGKYIYLCTNGLLLQERLKDFTRSSYLTFSVHLDGLRDRHDASTRRPGAFDRTVEAIRAAIGQGFRVTVNTTLYVGETAEKAAAFLDFVTRLGVEGVTLAPGFSYEQAPRQEGFLGREASVRLFRELFRLGRLRKWPINHSALYLDFLAGNQSYRCTAWGTPTRNLFGWQKPCYLLDKEGYAPTFAALLEETPWDLYGSDRRPECANCMAHCGHEPTAVQDAFGHPLKALWVSWRGPARSSRALP